MKNPSRSPVRIYFQNRYNFRITTDITTGDVPTFLVSIYEHLPYPTSGFPLTFMKLENTILYFQIVKIEEF